MAEENKTLYEVSLKISTYDALLGKFVERLTTEHKIKKSDACLTDTTNDDWIRIEVEPGTQGYDNAKIIVNAHLRSAGDNTPPVNFTKPLAN